MARNAAGKKLFNNTLLTIKLFIMNKRFFTLMAAVLLAGAPLCNEAFALNNPAVATTAAKLQHGAKFLITAAGSSYQATPVVTANVAYATLGGPVTETLPGTSTIDVSKAAVFEVTNLATNALGVTVFP